MKPRITVAGCARDCGVHLDAIFDNLARLSIEYPRLSLVTVENDSIDNTSEILNRYARNFLRHDIFEIPGLAKSIPIRTQRLAFIRNLIIEVLKDGKYSDSDYVLMIDFDEVCIRPWHIETITRVIAFLEADSNLAACFSNCDGHYYDLWAFRHPKVCPGDIWLDSYVHRLKSNCTVEEAFNHEVAPKIFQIPTTLQPFQVDSAFGGMGIYKMRALRESTSRYLGEQSIRIATDKGLSLVRYQRCEHVSYHAGLTKQLGATLAIFPELITQNTHARRFIPGAMDALAIDTITLRGSSNA